MTPRALVTALLGRMTYDGEGSIRMPPGAEDFLHQALVEAEAGGPEELRAVVYELLKLIDVLRSRLAAPVPARRIADLLMTRPRCLGAIDDERARAPDGPLRAPHFDAPAPKDGQPVTSLLSPGELDRRRALGRGPRGR